MPEVALNSSRLFVDGWGGGETRNGSCAYLISALSLFHFISINKQTLGSWGGVRAEQMQPPAASLHSPHNEPDGTRADRCRRHFHSPPWGRGHTLPWKSGCWADGSCVKPFCTQTEGPHKSKVLCIQSFFLSDHHEDECKLGDVMKSGWVNPSLTQLQLQFDSGPVNPQNTLIQ